VAKGTASAIENKADKEPAGSKVVALQYRLTNLSGVPVDVRNFIPWNAYLLGGKTDAAKYNDTTTSLHEAMGLKSYPTATFSSASTWLLQPHASADWYLDWYVTDKTTAIVHNFYLTQKITSFGDTVKLP
jgi:hypothetical protein